MINDRKKEIENKSVELSKEKIEEKLKENI